MAEVVAFKASGVLYEELNVIEAASRAKQQLVSLLVLLDLLFHNFSSQHCLRTGLEF